MANAIPDSGVAPPGPRTRGAGTQTVYSILRQEILAMTLPPGSPLDEVGLSARFEMSRTPVREALLRLATEGLVTTLPNRSTIVTPIDFAALPTYFEALTLMYRVTARAAASRKDGEQLARVRAEQDAFEQAVAARDALGMIEANRNFHVAIADLGGNGYYTGFFTRLLDEGRRLLRLYYATFDDALPQPYVREHEELIAAIASGDAETADAIAARHAEQIVRQIQDYVARDVARARSLRL
ncbi:GntR family transcriptional regulator [Rhizobium halophytocola]|uniref:DNA-binding GntR family transcriptional regulator n=1 Tax=Rhizobium halophytocola TaxID=735519 RepID=A0ABS4E500_9HYPH|nr:GntR family transcriptional regulator [Rhizobium halophytocola]MBP1853025.1 DNA-binding GntR family transcriptional regulator [Rhizobium halophytocola]